MKVTITRCIEKIHLMIFGHQMNSEMRVFLGNLSWSFMAGIFIMPFMMIVTTLAGRFMGPIEYGKYSLLLVINQFLIIFIFFGLDTASLKYIAKAKTFADKKKVISATSNFVFLMLTILIVLTLLSYPFFIRFFNNYSIYPILATFCTLIVSFKIMFDYFIRGMENFKKQVQAKTLEIVVILITFILVFFILKKNTFIGFVFVLNMGALAISLFYFFHFYKYLGRSKKTTILELLGEGKLFFISTLLGTIYLAADKIVITRYLGIKTLGIYSAYYLASFTLITQMTQIFNNVFFPATARLENKSFTKKIDKILIFGFFPFSLVAGAMMMVILLIFGKAYPVNFIYIIGFSLYSILYLFQLLYNTVILDISKVQYKKYLTVITSINLATIASYIVAVYLNIISITFILGALIINSLITIFIERLFIRSMQND